VCFFNFFGFTKGSGGVGYAGYRRGRASLGGAWRPRGEGGSQRARAWWWEADSQWRWLGLEMGKRVMGRYWAKGRVQAKWH
jgi:hypothetical protein